MSVEKEQMKKDIAVQKAVDFVAEKCSRSLILK